MWVGLSGLITPSLDEMMTVAREMNRQGFDIPLLIGGAATSPAHTAVRIAPEYPNGVIHVRDASRSVTTMNALVSDDSRQRTLEETAERYAAIRADRESRRAQSAAALAGRGAVAALANRRIHSCATTETTRHQGIQQLPTRRAGGLYQLDAVLRRVGVARRVPGDIRQPDIRHRSAKSCSKTPNRCYAK